MRRCAESWRDGRFVLEQDTNAYAVLPPTQWQGYIPPPDVPPPASWGAPARVPDAHEDAVIEQRTSGDLRSIVSALENDDRGSLAAALASLGRTMTTRDS